MAITLTVPGQPVPQPRPRISTWGGRGRAYTPAAHPIKAYREAIVLLARADGGKIDGPTSLSVLAVFKRAASHWRKNDLSPAAPPYPNADGDNVLKAVADALTDAGVWPDDNQVLRWEIVKRFAARGEQPRTVITVSEFA